MMTEDEAIKIIENPNNSKNTLEIALLVLSHSGKYKALKAIEKFMSMNKDPGLEFWAETAMGECMYFAETMEDKEFKRKNQDPDVNH